MANSKINYKKLARQQKEMEERRGRIKPGQPMRITPRKPVDVILADNFIFENKGYKTNKRNGKKLC